MLDPCCNGKQMYLFLFCVCLPVLNCQYFVSNTSIPSYLKGKVPYVGEDKFPSKILINVSFTKFAGTLFYSVDANKNQLIILLINNTAPSLLVEYRRQQQIFLLKTLCKCNPCLYTPLAINIRIGGNLILTCNKHPYAIMTFTDSILQNENFPLVNFPKLTSNSAEFWLINTNQEGKAQPNNKQMEGCILSFAYNDAQVSTQIKGSGISNGCTAVCNANVCNGGQCYETYNKSPLCNCTYTFGNGPLCANEIRSVNKNCTDTFRFSAIKISWRANTSNIFTLQNKEILLQLQRTNKGLYFIEKNEATKSYQNDTLTTEYKGDLNYTLLVFFENKVKRIQLLHETVLTVDATTELSKVNFQYLTLSSGVGVIDFAFKASLEDVEWKKWAFDEGTAKCLDDDSNGGRLKLLALLLLLLPLLFLLCLLRRFRAKGKMKTRRMVSKTIPDAEILTERVMERDSVESERPLENLDLLLLMKQIDQKRLQIFHFKKYSVLCSTEISNFMNEWVTALKESVLPLKRIIIFHNQEEMVKNLNAVRIIPLQYKHISDPRSLCHESVVVDSEETGEKIQELVQNMRSWDIKFVSGDVSVSGHDLEEESELKINIKKFEEKWQPFHPVIVNVQEVPFYAYVPNDAKVGNVKSILKKFLIHHFTNQIRKAAETPGYENNVIKLLNKMMTVRIPLMFCFDGNWKKLPDNKKIKDIPNIDSNGGFNMQLSDIKEFHYDPPVDQTNFTNAVVLDKITETSILVRSVLDKGKALVIKRIPYLNGSEIKEKMKNTFGIHSETILVSRNKELTDNCADFGDVLSFAIISSFQDPTVPYEITKREENLFQCVAREGSREVFAIKRTNRESLVKTVLVLAKLEFHKNLINYRLFHSDSTSFYMCRDWLKESLSEYIQKSGSLSENKIIVISYGILKGLAYLHEQKIIYRNLKGPNVLLDEEDNVKLTDFEFAYSEKGGKELESITQISEKTTINKINWTAPEIIVNMKCSFWSDIWSFGATVVEMIDGKCLFHDMSNPDIVHAMKRKDEIKWNENLSTKLNEILKGCLCFDTTARFTCEQLLTKYKK